MKHRNKQIDQTNRVALSHDNITELISSYVYNFDFYFQSLVIEEKHVKNDVFFWLKVIDSTIFSTRKKVIYCSIIIIKSDLWTSHLLMYYRKYCTSSPAHVSWTDIYYFVVFLSLFFLYPRHFVEQLRFAFHNTSYIVGVWLELISVTSVRLVRRVHEWGYGWGSS